MGKLLRKAALIGLIALALLEVTLRVVRNYSASVQRIVSPPGLSDWQASFVDNHRSGAAIYHGLLVPHPTLGWIPQPNRSILVDDLRYTTNQHGMRSPRDYQHQPDKFNVLILGDSFTFGDEADDSFVWPNMLQAKDPRLNVMNFAVTAYGTDQMYLLLKQEIGALKPDLVIAAIIEDDLIRSMLDFRDYQKPKFILEGGRLVLTNTPIADPGDVYRELTRSTRWSPLFVNAFRNLQRESPEFTAGEVFQLNRRIFEGMSRAAREVDADFMLVRLDGPDGSGSTAMTSQVSEFLRGVKQLGGTFVDLTDHFVRGENYDVQLGHHFQRTEAGVVSAVVYQKILSLPSWRRGVRNGSG